MKKKRSEVIRRSLVQAIARRDSFPFASPQFVQQMGTVNALRRALQIALNHEGGNHGKQ